MTFAGAGDAAVRKAAQAAITMLNTVLLPIFFLLEKSFICTRLDLGGSCQPLS
jgi:hypothetical protein